jgi:propanediol utilization protein
VKASVTVSNPADAPTVLVAIPCDSRKHASVPVAVALDSFSSLEYPKSRLGLLLVLSLTDGEAGASLLDAVKRRTAIFRDDLRYFNIVFSDSLSTPSPHERAAYYRQKIVDETRRTDFDYLLFLDSDTAIPPFTLRNLVELHPRIAAGVCTPRWTVLEKASLTERLWAYRYTFDPSDRQEIRLDELNGVVDVDMVGFGCALVSREVFEKVDFTGYKFDSKVRVGEDAYFCVKAAELFAEKVKLHTGVRTAHVDEAGNVNIVKAVPAHRLVRVITLMSGVLLSAEHYQQLRVLSQSEQITLIGPTGESLALPILGASARTSIRLTRSEAASLGLDTTHPVAGKPCRARLRKDQTDVEFEILMDSLFIDPQLVVATKCSERLGLRLGERVAVRIESLRPVILTHLSFKLEDVEESRLLLDAEEANAAWVNNGDYGELLTSEDLPDQLIKYEGERPDILARKCGWFADVSATNRSVF